MEKTIAILTALIMVLSITASVLPMVVGAEIYAATDDHEGNAHGMRPSLPEDQGTVDVDVLESDSSGTSIDVHVQDVQEEEIEVNNETFQVLTLSGYAHTSEVGKPQIPVIRETVGIPDGASVQVTILDATYSTYTGYNVYPVQPPKFDSGEGSDEFVIDEDFYSQDAFYPEELVEVGDPAIWRDLSVVGLQVNPVMFNPATGELRVYDHIKVKLEYSDGVSVTKTIEPKFARMYRSVVLNYDFLDIVAQGGFKHDDLPAQGSNGPNKGVGTVDVDVLDSDSSGTIVDVHVQDVQEGEMKVNNETFQVLTLSDYAHTSEVGKPQIPVIRETLGIPDGASVRATILDSSYSTYTGYNVYPVQPPEFDSGVDGELVIDDEFYSQDAFYPEELVEVGDPAIWRDLSVVGLQVNPVMFNPATGELRVYDHIKVELEYSDGEVVIKTIKPKFARMYRSVILHFDYLDIVIPETDTTTTSFDNVGRDDLDTPADQTVKYLSIRHDGYSSYASIKPLLDHHEAEGLPYISWMYYSWYSPTAQDIKDLIESYYTSYPELEYVLIVGDIDFLPWKSSWDGVPSDYWFGCVAGGDLYAELAVGRLSANNDAEIQQQVNKILSYSLSPPAGDWVDRVLLVAHKQDAPGKYQGCKEEIRTATYSNPFTFDTAYGASAANGGDDATNADVTNAINSGRGIVNYRGHGSKTYWGSNWNTANEEYTTTTAHALANGGMTPVVFSIACWNAALDNTAECLGEAFVKDDDSAVAFLGATRPSYTIPNHDFDKNLFDAIGNEYIYDIGWVSNDANAELITKYGSTSYAMDNVKMYLWLGDPALRLWTHAPGAVHERVGVFRPSNGYFFLDWDNSLSWTLYDKYGQFGTNGDIPIVTDWYWDSSVDNVGVFRPSSGYFFLDLDNSLSWTGGDHYGQFGTNGDIPIVGNFFETYWEDVGVFRPSSGYFFLDQGSLSWGSGDRYGQFGTNGDIPVAGDWNGDGIDEVGVFRPSCGYFFIDYDNSLSWTGADKYGQFGTNGDIPIVIDYWGDGVDDVGVFRPSNGYFFLDIDNSLSWTGADRYGQFGTNGDIPIVGDWFAMNWEDVGVFRPSNGYFFLDAGSLSWTSSDRHGQFGTNGDIPIVGNWAD